MAGGSDPSIGGWLDHPMLGDFLFYFIFAAIARGPLAFATRWIWAACASRSFSIPFRLALSPSASPARRVHGFPYCLAAIARGPLAFATHGIWAVDIAESIETAAVRAPLCAPFLGFRRSFPRWSRQARVDPR